MAKEGEEELMDEMLQEVTNYAETAKTGGVMNFLQGLVPDLIAFGLKVVLAFVIYFIGTKLIKMLRKVVRGFLERSEIEKGIIQFLDSFLKIGLFVCLILLICGWFGLSAASVVAVLGSAGLAVGLALQGSLSNFAGGVLILLIKPFKVGDYIIEGGFEGTVTSIELFYTRLNTGDNQVVIIPNGILANSRLINVTRQEKRRLDISVGISYQADLKEVKKVLENVLKEEKRRVFEEDVQVVVLELAASSVQMGCRIWVPTGDYSTVKSDLLEKIKITLDENHIEMPYNQLDVSIKQK